MKNFFPEALNSQCIRTNDIKWQSYNESRSFLMFYMFWIESQLSCVKREFVGGR